MKTPRWNLQTRILALTWAVRLIWAAPLALLFFSRKSWLVTLSTGWFFLCLVLTVFSAVALSAWQNSLRRQFIREAMLPRHLGAKLRQHYPHLSLADVELVLRGLREFFVAYVRSRHKFVAMPSQVVDVAWHEFILHTRAYAQWCNTAFGRMLHHTPAEVLGTDPKCNDGLRRTWYWSCKEESIDPRVPTRLPLLFALDAKLKIPDGFSYVPDCRDIAQKAGSDAYCGTSFGNAGGGSGDAVGFGGEVSGGSDGGGDSGCGGGCGGD